jgi:hypothetical protein
MRDWAACSRLSLLATVIAGLAFFAPCGATEDSPTATGEASQNTARVIAYYFHGNFRCVTCRTIEAYAEEAITKGFANELASGRLAWRVINTDEPENKHFIRDFELVTKSLVLVEYRDGKVARHENLKEIWQLLRDKESFLNYVRTSTRNFLEKG